MSERLPSFTLLEGRMGGGATRRLSVWEPVENVKIGGKLHPEGFEETDEDRWQQTLAVDNYPAEAGMPLADFECRHGSLPTDTNVQCICFITEEATLKITKGQIIAAVGLAYQVGAQSTIELKNYGAMGALAMVVERDGHPKAYRLPPEGGSEPLAAVPVE